MIIRRNRWLLIVALFVLGPIAGVVAGGFGGPFLVESLQPGDEVEYSEVVVETSEDSNASTLASKQVVLPGGEAIGLDELAPGRKVAIVVMKDVNCPVCQRQLRGLSQRIGEIQRRGATVVGLSDASRCANQRLMRRANLNFPVVADSNQEVLKAVEMNLPDRPYVMPGIIFLDEQGDVEFVHKGRAPGQERAQERLILQRF